MAVGTQGDDEIPMTYEIVGVMTYCDMNTVVRRRGLEPLHLLRRQDLNLVRLPISPPSPADSSQLL